MKKPEINLCETPEGVARSFGDYLMGAIKKSQIYHCALSGGSTPLLLFDYLATAYGDSAEWKKVHFFWGDERCVAPNHPESNYKMAKEALLDKIDIPAANIHRIMGETAPAGEADRYTNELMNFLPFKNEVPMLDMVVLGLGTDGHTASLFPHQIELITSNNLCEVADHPDSGQKRVTLTARMINGAGEVVFLVTGDNKKEKVSEIIHRSGNWIDYPASYIHPMSEKLSWFMDKAAGSGL